VTCNDREDSILLYALDALDAVERTEILAHLETGCERCAAALAEARTVVASMAMTAEPVPVPPGAGDRLMERIRVASSPTLPLAPTPALPIADSAEVPSRQRSLRWLGRALIAACIGALFGGLAVWLPLREQARLPGATEVHVIALKGGETQPLARGRIFWDLARHTWQAYVFDLKPPPADNSYPLWFVTSDDKKVRAGTLLVDARGTGSLFVPQREDIGPIVAGVVTLEPLGSFDQPTGPIQLSGTLR
jgi:anti-sigma-K factor RskA